METKKIKHMKVKKSTKDFIYEYSDKNKLKIKNLFETLFVNYIEENKEYISKKKNEYEFISVNMNENILKVFENIAENKNQSVSKIVDEIFSDKNKIEKIVKGK